MKLPSLESGLPLEGFTKKSNNPFKLPTHETLSIMFLGRICISTQEFHDEMSCRQLKQHALCQRCPAVLRKYCQSE